MTTAAPETPLTPPPTVHRQAQPLPFIHCIRSSTQKRPRPLLSPAKPRAEGCGTEQGTETPPSTTEQGAMGTLPQEELNYEMPPARPVSGEECVHPRYVGDLNPDLYLLAVACGQVIRCTKPQPPGSFSGNTDDTCLKCS